MESQIALTPQPDGGPLHAVLRRVVDVRVEEVRAMLMAFAYFFFVLSGWFVLRPIREAAGVAAGTAQLPWLFAGTLAAMLICNPLFSSLVVRYPVRRFIAITYHFFIANLLGFYVAMRIVAPTEGSAGDVWVGRAFFIWTSVFNLFVVSVFWCFMADYFRSEQAKRLFGFVAVGGTLGSIAGSGATAVLASHIGTPNLILVSAALLELAVVAVLQFPARGIAGAGAAGAPPPQQLPIGGSIWAGVTHVVRSPYLLGIAGFLVLLTMGSTVLYFEQADIVRRSFADRAARTTVLAQIEFAVQTLTLVTQVFFTGRIIRWLGLAAALAYLPVLSMLGFAALGVLPVFAAVALFVVLRRAGNFALTNPAMEILFTVVPREDKYKAKSFIETFVYRGGDQAGAWSFAGLSALGLGLTGIAFAAVPMAAVMLALAVWLGRRQGTLAAAQADPSPELA
ncbi:MAG TPA: MFS transporter [Gemmatimonadaceae bacterium]|nr:MFS transporter [Gemmatimonadaceae bacterium]